jgi:hypothetical protein
MATQTFELVSPFLTVYAPSKKWAGDNDLLLGQTSNRLVTGEMLEYTGANSVKRTTTALTDNAAVSGLTVWCAPYFSETGRGDIVTGGSVPVLQFGPYEADTMLFMRSGDNAMAAGVGGGALTNAPHAGLTLGARVYAAPVRNPISGNFTLTDYVIGVAPASGIDNESFETTVCVGRISRVGIGSGATAKIRVMFGVQ